MFLTLALLLTVSFAFAGNNSEKNTKSNQISFVNRTANTAYLTWYSSKTNSTAEENAGACSDNGESCYMTLDGTTNRGIHYHISGHCGNVLRKLRKLEQL